MIFQAHPPNEVVILSGCPIEMATKRCNGQIEEHPKELYFNEDR